MKSFKDFEPSVQCDECDKYLLIGDNPNNPIFETCDDCVREQKSKGESMSRLVGFLQDDLKEIDESFESVKQIMEDKIYYENRGDLENHIERIDRFISYWKQHAKSLEEA